MVVAMSRLSLGLFRALMLLGALALWAFAAAKELAAFLGTTTFADAYRWIVERTPSWADLVATLPWWVVPLVAAVPTLFLVWPFRARRRQRRETPSPAPQAAVEPSSAPTEDRRATGRPGAGGYLKEQHIYAGSARLSMVPEFRAIPVRHIASARIFIEYSSYATDIHAWEPRRRILVAEVHDQEVGDWSVINVELMTCYENEAGGLIWRWARELDYGAPQDEDYAFAIEDHYQARVVFAGPDGSEQYSYFAIMPSKDYPSDMPNLISQGIFDFMDEWEQADRKTLTL